MINFLDTSAVLNGFDLFDNIYISPLVIAELENIKNSTKSEHLKYLARKAVRDILNSNTIKKFPINQKQVDKLLKKYSFLSNINDHKLLCEAMILNKEEEEVKFITCDGALYLFSTYLPIKSLYIQPQEEIDIEVNYCGWSKHYPNQEQMAALYSNPTINTLNLKVNEFAEIFEDNKLKDVLFWTGEKYRNLNYTEFKTALGDKIKPRNLEQKMYLDLLQNQNVPVKLCIARFGTGKSFMALNYALDAIKNGRFDKIVFIKNNLEVKGAGRLGTLPGSEIQKQMPWLRQIEDHIGIQKFEEYIADGLIEPAHLSSIRGRDLKNCCVLVDEAENLLTTNIQLLLGRIAENSEIIFCADVKQCDYQDEKMSGIPILIDRLKGNKLFGMVKLLKTERSETAALADLLD